MKLLTLSTTFQDNSLSKTQVYSNNGRTPPYMSSYERYSLGWLEPIPISAADTIFILPDISQNKAYIIKTKKKNEYFLLENRRQHSWDSYIPGHGMLVWHIDYDTNVWNRNVVNNTPSHQYVDIEEADNLQSDGTRNGDSFPGSKGITSLTDDTAPGLRSWNDSKQNLSIVQISETDNIITFTVLDSGVKLNVPQVKSATDVTSSSFRANWEKTTDATAYELDVYLKKEGNMRYLSGYQRRNTGDVNSFVVDGLDHDTDYYYVVRGKSNVLISSNSEEIQVQTSTPSFDSFVPKATGATSITSHSFIANWKKMEGSQEYFVYVSKKIKGTGSFERNDFTGQITDMPDGWNTTCTSTYGSAGYYGEESPALRFDKDQSFLESPTVEDDITSLGFWYRGASAAVENAFLVSGYNGYEWIAIDSIGPINNDSPGEQYSLSIGELSETYKTVRITYLKPGSGSVAVDDIVIGITQTGREMLSGYNGKSAGNELSLLIDGLDENTYYIYNVKAFDGTLYSKESNGISVFVPEPGVNIESVPGGINISVSDNVLIVKNLTSEQQRIDVYTLLGELLATEELPHGNTNITLPAKQVYIVRIGKQAFKVVL